MSFMTNGWYLPHHVMIIVLNNSFIMTLRLLIIFVIYDYNTRYKLNHIFEIFLLMPPNHPWRHNFIVTHNHTYIPS